MVKKNISVSVGHIDYAVNNVDFSIRHAIKGKDLSDLKKQMEISLKETDEEDKKTRTALASLEGNIAKLIQDLGNN